jgi:hypothetical protein
MEKNSNKSELDNKDEVDEEVDEKTSSNNSKKKVFKKSDLSLKKARFFRTEKTEEQGEKPTVSNEKIPQEVEENFESQNDEEFDELTEEEVHEALLAIVDARMQDVSEELNNADNESAGEYVAMSNAIFLESLAERANSEKDFTPTDIEEAYKETVEDISLDDSEESSVNEIGSDEGESPEPPQPTDSFNDSVEVGAEDYEPRAVVQIPSIPTSIPLSTTSLEPLVPSVEHDEYEAYIPRSDMLLGLVVGYIIGRRGGRKRTEKEYKPRLEKLEKQVTELTEIVSKKEVLIRKQALKIYEQSFDKADKTAAVIERRRVRNQVKEQLTRREELLQDSGVEKIGKFSLPALKVFHEKRLLDGNENSPKRVQVEVMTAAQLIEKVEDLKIDNISVKLMYENNRLKIDVLRQITKEYLRGGEYKKTFYRELLPDPNELENHRSKIEYHHENARGLSNNSQSNEQNTNEKIVDTNMADNLGNTNNYAIPNKNIAHKPVLSAVVAVIVLVIAVIVIILR